MSGTDALERLVTLIVAANEPIVVDACAGLPQPIARVALFDGGFSEWLDPGSIWICSEQRRAELRMEGGWEEEWAFWDYDVELSAALSKTGGWRELVPAVSEALDPEFSPTRRVVREVVRRLNDPARLRGIHRTDDFVVFRAERFPELLEDLNVSTPPTTLELLRERRQVPVWMDSVGNEGWR